MYKARVPSSTLSLSLSLLAILSPTRDASKWGRTSATAASNPQARLYHPTHFKCAAFIKANINLHLIDLSRNCHPFSIIGPFLSFANVDSQPAESPAPWIHKPTALYDPSIPVQISPHYGCCCCCVRPFRPLEGKKKEKVVPGLSTWTEQGGGGERVDAWRVWCGSTGWWTDTTRDGHLLRWCNIHDNPRPFSQHLRKSVSEVPTRDDFSGAFKRIRRATI